jgi:hypothetical protein
MRSNAELVLAQLVHTDLSMGISVRRDGREAHVVVTLHGPRAPGRAGSLRVHTDETNQTNNCCQQSRLSHVHSSSQWLNV